MPTKPANMDHTPPVMKAQGVNLESISPLEANAITSRMKKTTTTTFAKVVY